MFKTKIKAAAWAVTAALAAYMLWPAWVAAVDDIIGPLPMEEAEEAAAEEAPAEEAPPGEEAVEEQAEEQGLLTLSRRDGWLDVGTLPLAADAGEELPLRFRSWVLLEDVDPAPWLGDWREIARAARYYYVSDYEKPFDRGLMESSYRTMREEEAFYEWEQERGLIPDIEFGHDSDIKFEGRKTFSAGYSKTTYPGGSPYLEGEQPAGDVTMEGELQLRIEGTILRKTHVYVDYDDTRENDTRNQVSVVYKGDPDEFVQEAAFGDIMLSLPATEFVSYSSSRAVFGAKVDLKYKWARLMAVASREKGETERATFTGGAELTSMEVEDTSYTARRFFLLNTYSNKDNDKGYFDGGYDKGDRKIYKENGVPKIEVFVNYAIETGFPTGVTKYYFDGKEFDDKLGDEEVPYETTIIGRTASKKLARGTEYTVDVEKGIITFNTTIDEKDRVAVAYVIANGSNEPVNAIGYVESPPASGSYVLAEDANHVFPEDQPLKCIYEGKYGGAVQRYEQKNYYFLGSTNIRPGSLVVKILDKTGAEADKDGNTYLYLYGLDRDKNGRVDAGYLDSTNSYLIVPDVDPNNGFKRKDNGGWRSDRQYKQGKAYFDNLPFDYDKNGVAEGKDAYRPDDLENKRTLYFEFSSDKPSFFLRPNIIPGSETVTLNGKRLVPNQDYWLDYDSGFLEILAEGADDPGAVLDVTYEYKPFFALLTKSLVGGRFQFGPDDDRHLGTTLIAEFSTKPPSDVIPKVEEAPADHVIFDVDGRYRFYPEFMTKLANAVPGAHTTEGSTVDIEAEFARSRKDLNTVGEALVDDMESARQLSTVSMKREVWKHASAPGGELNQGNRGYALLTLETKTAYLNTVYQDWPADQLEVLEITRLPNNPDGDFKWGGIHRVLSPTGVDFTESRLEYVEIMMRLDNVYGGTIHMDLGAVDEDADGNTILGEEELVNGRLTSEKDVGYEFNNTDKEQPGEPPDPVGHIKTPINNKNIFDSEDNNLNGALDTVNNYFTYDIPVDEVASRRSPYVVRSENDPRDPLEPGWYILRIPFNFDTADTVGTPDATGIQVLRFWFEAENDTDFPSNSRVVLATVSFAAMKWDEPELSPDRGRNEMKISTKDSRNDADYVPLRSVEDPETKTTEREQALVLEYILTDWEDVGVKSEEGFLVWGAGNNEYDTEDTNHNGVLDAGEDVGVGPYHIGAGNGRLDEEPAAEGTTRYTTYDGVDYSHYHKMRFYYFNRTPQDPGPPDSDNDIIFVRFGADDDNYFEYSTQMDGRQEWIGVTVDLERFLALHTKGQPFIEADEAIVHEHYRIVGDPSLLNVVETRVGVRTKLPRDGGSGGFLAYREVWVNDILLLEPEPLIGKAMRGSAAFDFGNFIKTSGGFRNVGAGFEEIGTTSTARSTTTSKNAEATVELGKFTPDLWNIRMPLSGSVSKSETLTEDKFDPKQSIYAQGRTIGVSRRIAIAFSKYKLPSGDFTFRNSDSINYKYGRTVESDTYSGGVDYEIYPRKRYLPTNIRSDFDRDFRKTGYTEKEKQSTNTDWVTDDSRNSVKFEPIEDFEITPSYDYDYTRDRIDKTEDSFGETYGLRADYFYIKGLRPSTSYSSSYREIVFLGVEEETPPEFDGRGPDLGENDTMDLSLSTSYNFTIPVDMGKLTDERTRGINKWSITPSYDLVRASSYTEMKSRAPLWYRIGSNHVLPEFADTGEFVNSRRRYSITVNNRFHPLEFLGYRTGTKWENWDFIQTDFDYSYSNEISNTLGTPTRITSTTFPDVTCQLYGKTNFPLVAAYLERSTVVVGYVRRRTYQQDNDIEVQQTPSVSWRANWLYNFRTRADYRYTHTKTEELEDGDVPTDRLHILTEKNPSLTLYYDIANPRGFKIPILGTLRWRNELNLSAGVSFTETRGIEAMVDDTDEWVYTVSGGYRITTNLHANVEGTVTRFKNLSTVTQDYRTISVLGNFEIQF